MLRLRVVRSYPIMFCVKDGGRSTFLTEKEWEARRSRGVGDEGVQKIYREVEEKIKKEEGIVGQKLKVRERDLAVVECGEELLRLVTASGDPGIVACLNLEQREMMEQAGRRQNERVRSKVEEEVQERLREERRGADLFIGRPSDAGNGEPLWQRAPNVSVDCGAGFLTNSGAL